MVLSKIMKKRFFLKTYMYPYQERKNHTLLYLWPKWLNHTLWVSHTCITHIREYLPWDVVIILLYHQLFFFLSQTIYIPFPQRCCALTTEIPYWVLYFPLKKFSNILSPWNIHFHSLFLTPSKLYSVFYYYLDCPLLFPWILCALLTNNNWCIETHWENLQTWWLFKKS